MTLCKYCTSSLIELEDYVDDDPELIHTFYFCESCGRYYEGIYCCNCDREKMIELDPETCDDVIKELREVYEELKDGEQSEE